MSGLSAAPPNLVAAMNIAGLPQQQQQQQHHQHQQQQPVQAPQQPGPPPLAFVRGGGGGGGAAAAIVPQADANADASTNNNNNGNNSSSNKNNNNSSSKARNRSWDENYAQLLTYKATHDGSTDVPLTYKHDRILGKWVAHLREHQNQAALSQERKDALNAIGFIWDPHQKKWDDMYQRLKEFKAKTGHCKVPTNWKADRKLGKWVMRQREKRKNNLLPEDRLRKLEDIGFVWAIYAEAKGRKSNVIDQKWNSRFEELKEYQKVHDHCNVPKDYGPLGKWVQEQRVMHQRKLLKPERKKLLQDIGFVFSYRAQKCQQDWNQMYELLKACSTTTEDGQFKVLGMDVGLNRWVHRQKEAYRTHRLDPGREVLLNKINFQFPERGPVPVKGVNPPMPGSEPTETCLKAPPTTNESDKFIGVQLEQGIEVISKYMGISPSQLSQRLMMVPEEKTEEKPEEKEAEKKKPGKKQAQLPIAEDETEPKQPEPKATPCQPSPQVNAFARLLPKLLALKDLGEETMAEGVRYLENFVRQEKGWDPRPSDWGVYNRLLSLSAELGVLLNPASERCQSIIKSAEVQLERVMARKIKAQNEEIEKKRKFENDEDDSGEISKEGDGDGDNEKTSIDGDSNKQEEGKDQSGEDKEEENEVDVPAAKKPKTSDEGEEKEEAATAGNTMTI